MSLVTVQPLILKEPPERNQKGFFRLSLVTEGVCVGVCVGVWVCVCARVCVCVFILVLLCL